ncbi:MAG: anthranilate synthase component I family protein [Flavobacteriales bacterium]
MRQKLELPPLPSIPADPEGLMDGPIAFLHSGEEGRDLLAMGKADEIKVKEPGEAFSGLSEFLERNPDWAFGAFSYELKNELEELLSCSPQRIGAPVLHFFRPKVLFHLGKERTVAEYLPKELAPSDVQAIHKGLSRCDDEKEETSTPRTQLRPRTEKDEYLNAVRSLQGHIQQGDIYEVNHCQEFFAEASISPYRTFKKLQRIARAPMAAYYRSGNIRLICASPERFLQIEDRHVLAQPIKGTAPRGKGPKEDEEQIETLRQDPKERAENIMIVDLLRNDLSRTAEKGSVKVEELCGIHPFPTVHQMISSIRSRIASDRSPLEVISEAFPMGSMTGAPKVRAMELIEAHEGMRRGLYSGSVGYVDPQGNWDLNVVIRSLVYDAQEEYLSAMVGSAITARSDPEKEYQECLLKAEALKKAIG